MFTEFRWAIWYIKAYYCCAWTCVMNISEFTLIKALVLNGDMQITAISKLFRLAGYHMGLLLINLSNSVARCNTASHITPAILPAHSSVYHYWSASCVWTRYFRISLLIFGMKILFHYLLMRWHRSGNWCEEWPGFLRQILPISLISINKPIPAITHRWH